MKKMCLLVFAFAILLSACGTSVTVPVMTATPETTATTAFTSTPELTATPEATPTPDFSKPAAVVAPDKAEFSFPLPEQEWDWFVETCNPCFPRKPVVEREWRVLLELDKTYALQVVCYSDTNQTPQKGSTSEMLAACSGIISEVTEVFNGGDHIETIPSSFSDLTFSYDSEHSRLLMELTDSVLTQLLYDKKPEVLVFYSELMSDYTDPQHRSYRDQLYNVVVSLK